MSFIFFSLIYGLITSFDQTSENGGLFFSEYIRLKSDIGIEYTDLDREIYNTKMDKAKVKEGLYKRDATKDIRTVSHDEITGMLVSSKLLGTTHANEIWNFLTSHIFIYDYNGSRPYPAFHPAWIYFWGELVGVKWTKMFYPLALLNITLATLEGSEQETSGKLLYFTLLKRDSTLYSLYSNRMVKIYGTRWVEEMFSVYFHTEPLDHPLRYLSSKLSDLHENIDIR